MIYSFGYRIFEDQKQALAANFTTIRKFRAAEIPQTRDLLMMHYSKFWKGSEGNLTRKTAVLPAQSPDGPPLPFPARSAKETFISKEQKREITELLTESVTKLTRSGIFDHLQGGFFLGQKIAALTHPFLKDCQQSAQMLKVLAHLAELTRDSLFLEGPG